MSIASDKSVFELYPDGSKCNEYITDLSNTDSMTWEAVYWRAKYLYTYGRDICSNQDLIDYFNECLNQGLSVNANQEIYMDARKMQSALYIAEEDFKMTSNCIQAVLDITEDIPAEMFLDLTYAEVHTDLLRILKSPVMFFNDLHMADSYSELLDRQKSIVQALLLKAAEARSKDSDIAIDVARIEKEVVEFGLAASDEYVLFKKVLAGEATPVVIPAFKPKTVESKPAEPKKSIATKPVEDKPTAKTPKKRNSEGLLEIIIFPEDKQEEKKEEPKKVVEEPQVKPTEEPVIQQPAEKVEEKPKDSFNMTNIENMFATLMATVTENANQIASLHGKIQKISDDSETEKIRAELAESEEKNQKLLEQFAAANAQIVENEKQLEEREKLLLESEKQIAENQKQIAENEKRIAEKEQEKTALEEKIAAQNALLEAKKNAEFSEEDLKSFEEFERVIIIDTCAIEHQPELLDYITDKEMVRISKTVIQELENHKKYKYDIEKQKIGQRCLKAIRAAKKTMTDCDYEDCYTFLLPEALRIKEEDDIGTANDKEIFSLALRYKIHSNIPVLIISDDTTMQIMADSEHIENITAEDFIAGREKTVVPVVNVKEELTEEQFLAKKLKYHDYGLSQSEVTEFKRQGINTVGDLLGKDTTEFQFMKNKKGIPLTAKITQIYEKAKKHHDSLFHAEASQEEDN